MKFLDLDGLQKYHATLMGVIPSVDDKLDDTTNPVQNKVIKSAIDDINATLGDVQSVLDSVLNGGNI